MIFDYDERADVMYISFGDKPKAGVVNEEDDGIFIRKDLNTGEVVGITFLDFKRFILPIMYTEDEVT